ncbi:MAG: ATP-binding protein, partial [Solirubrobacterales bacterium]
TDGDFGDLGGDAQLVVYRVAQEALSNAVRHSGADHLRVRLLRADGRVELSIGDDGRGFTFDQAARGLGIGGMRERALLVGGDLQVTSRPEIGTRVRLLVPIRENDDGDGHGGTG